MIGLLLAAQLAVVAHAPDTASACAPIDVTVAARAPGSIPPRIVAGPIGPSLQLLKSTILTRVERDGAGQPSALTEASFTYTADAPIRVTLPTFTASVGAKSVSATTDPVTVHNAASLPPTVLVRAWLDRGNGRGAVDSLYVGQQMDYVVDVHLNEAARTRLRRNPTFFPPEMPGVLAYDLAAPSAVTRSGRRCFETLSYRRALFPLFAGRSVIAPAALTYSLPLSTSFFSREESFELRTDSVRFYAFDVPAADRPPAFGGAVGSLSVSSRLSTQQARMGDPVVLTLRVEGTGNVKLWPRPPLSLPWGTLADAAERVEVDTMQSRVRGAKEFDWLLTPRMAGDQKVPAIEYPYFDAEQQRYGLATTPPLALDVVTAALATVDSTPVARLAIRRVLRDEERDPLSSRAWFWMLLAAAPVPAAVRSVRQRRSARRDTRTFAQRLRSAHAAREQMSPRALRRLYLGAVAERVPSTAGATRPDDFARSLRRSGVTNEAADRAALLFDHLDTAAFSSSGTLQPETLARVHQAVGEIDAQAVRPQSMRASRFLPALLLVVCVAVLADALPPGLDSTFKAGVEAYDHGAFTTSQRLFARVATRAPRAVDAWVNLGTAAWSRGDSAGAVRSWQRALRLDPLDEDARERITRVQPLVLRTPGYVPPIPPNALAGAALFAWVLAWSMLAFPPARRPVRVRAYAGASMTIAAVLLLAAVELRDRLDVRGLAVLRDTRLLLEAPSSSRASASGVIGETGVIAAREGAWLRLSLDNARAGWVPVASVLFMDAPPIDD